MAKYLDLNGLSRLIKKFKQILTSKADENNVVKLSGNQIIEGEKVFNHRLNVNGDFGAANAHITGALELPFSGKANNSNFIRFNLDNMPTHTSIDLFRTHYAGRKFALAAQRNASGDPYYQIEGDLNFLNMLKFIGQGSVLRFVSENGSSTAQYIEFLKGNTRLGIIGLASSTNDDITIESSGDRSLIMNAFNLTMNPRNLARINGRLQINTELLAGTGGSVFFFTPEDNSRKQIRFHRTNEAGRNNCIFDLNLDNKSKILNVPTPQANGDAANKLYVDALKTQIKNLAANAADFAAFQAALAHW